MSLPLFNGTIADEREVLDTCLDLLYLGDAQAVRPLTRSGLPPPAGEEKAISHLRENLEGPDEETLADFLTKNREHHPVEPGLNPGGRLICVGDEEFHHIFRYEEGRGRFRSRTAPSGSRGSDSTWS